MANLHEDNEHYTLQNAARPLGYFIGVHKTFDPVLGGGPYFVMPRKKHPDERCPTLLKFATAAEVEEFLQQTADDFAA
jgi:hypothetical protein